MSPAEKIELQVENARNFLPEILSKIQQDIPFEKS
jgi:hypothetical protein